MPARAAILSAMVDRPLLIDNSDYVLPPSVTHPQARERAFTDAFKAMVRFMVEESNNPAVAYAIEQTDRVVTYENMALLSEEDLDEWDDACDEFESMPLEHQEAWIDRV
ncbi:MAG: hypothetical protein KJ749_10650, partial [Planctomycetes bacterium]|nr:hypothetical protein [Planctomycetota bacterium]